MRSCNGNHLVNEATGTAILCHDDLVYLARVRDTFNANELPATYAVMPKTPDLH